MRQMKSQPVSQPVSEHQQTYFSTYLVISLHSIKSIRQGWDTLIWLIWCFYEVWKINHDSRGGLRDAADEAGVWRSPRPAHGDRVSQRAAVSSRGADNNLLPRENIPPPATHYRAALAPWWTVCGTNGVAVLPGSPPILASRAGSGVETRERILKMTSRLRWSREQLGRWEKKERSQS